MPASERRFAAEARLVVRVLPFVANEQVFALKGGTAINLFYRDMPRLSVDIDLTYLPLGERAPALAGIDAALDRIGRRLGNASRSYRIRIAKRQEGAAMGLAVSDGRAEIKVEANSVLRGSVFPAAPRPISARAESEFGFAEVVCLSFEDLYAGKLVAALDRQNPRDLFDISQLLDGEGLTERLLDAFVVYLASHGRPMSEVLAPTDKDIRAAYDADFVDMPSEPVSLAALLDARVRLVRELHRSLLPRQREFLRSVKALEPDWSLLPVPHAAELPGVRWRLHNLEKFRQEQPKRYAATRAALDRVLEAMG